MTEECIFCYEVIEDCRCPDFELITKKAFLKFFIESMKEFFPKKSTSVHICDAVDFVNEWFDRNLR